MTAGRRVVVGIDFGGTGVRFVAMSGGIVVAESGHLTATLGAGEAPARIARVAGEIRRLVRDRSSLAGVGIGATGPVDLSTGEIHNPATLPDFSGIGLAPALAERLGCPVVIDNDAVTAALGEQGAGAGRGSGRFLMITLGTGVGGALLVDGVPWRTGTGAHPEIGHLPLFDGGPSCYCGLAGCWEPQASRVALQQALAGHLGRLAIAEILPVAEERFGDDPVVRTLFHRYGERVGRGISCLQAVYGPTTVAVGGGAARYFSLFETGIRAALTQSAEYTQPSRVVVAMLGERAGAIGAALLIGDRPLPPSAPSNRRRHPSDRRED